MNPTTKGTMVATLKSTSAQTKAANGSFEAILSVPTFDRDREIVDAKAFDPLPDHITIDLDHAMTVEKTVGSGRPFYDGEILKFEGTFASTPLAQMTRALVDEGHIRTMSVAYNEAQYEVDKNDGLKHLRSAELLNAGIVGIPANRDALITASKSLIGDVLANVQSAEVVAEVATKAVDYDELVLLQTAHDALVQLGVECKSAHEGDTEISTETNPETKAATAADAAVTADPPPAAVNVGAMARVRALAAQAELTLL